MQVGASLVCQDWCWFVKLSEAGAFSLSFFFGGSVLWASGLGSLVVDAGVVRPGNHGKYGLAQVLFLVPLLLLLKLLMQNCACTGCVIVSVRLCYLVIAALGC